MGDVCFTPIPEAMAHTAMRDFDQLLKIVSYRSEGK